MMTRMPPSDERFRRGVRYARIRDLDQWVSDFAVCDFAHLRHFYETREKRAFRGFWKDGQPLLQPLTIPEFRPTRWVARYQGIVV